MTEKYQWFDCRKFTRDDKTGYYLNSTIRKRMHVYVWEYYNGDVPKGYEIHHIDFNKANNDIDNLQLLTIAEHKQLHGVLLTDEQREWKRNNLNEVARPKAIEWHKSAEGREWHKKQFELTYDALHRTITKNCAQCGKEFVGEIKTKFCCNACKSAYRRTQGLDKVDAICICCGKTFQTNKYRKAKTCSRSCAGKYRMGVLDENKISEKDK